MQTPLAISASLLAVLIWLISRRRPAAALNSVAQGPAVVAPMARVLGPEGDQQPPGGAAVQPLLPQPSRQYSLRACKAAMVGNLNQRLAAVQQLSQQRDRRVLPLLKQALRDSHPAVVRAAARALEAYRGRPAATATPVLKAASRLPRNAAPRAGSA